MWEDYRWPKDWLGRPFCHGMGMKQYLEVLRFADALSQPYHRVKERTKAMRLASNRGTRKLHKKK